MTFRTLTAPARTDGAVSVVFSSAVGTGLVPALTPSAAG